MARHGTASGVWKELLLSVLVAVVAVSFAQEKPNVVILFADDVSESLSAKVSELPHYDQLRTEKTSWGSGRGKKKNDRS